MSLPEDISLASDSANTPSGRLGLASWRSVRRLLRELLAREKGTVAGVLALFIVTSAAGAAVPVVLGRVIDGISDGWTIQLVNITCAALLVFVACQLVTSRIARRTAHRFGERTAAHVREVSLQRILALPLNVIERAGIGDLATRTTGDVTAVTTLFRSTGPAVVAAVLELAVLVAAAIIISPTLALLLVLALPLVALAARRYAIRSREPFEAERGALSELVHETVATEMGARTVAAHELGAERIALSDDTAESVFQNRRAILRLQTWILPVLDLASVGPAALIIFLGGLWVLQGTGGVTVGTLVGCAMVAYRLSSPLEVIMYSLNDLQTAIAALARIRGIPATPNNGRTLIPRDSEVEIHDASFRYGEGPDVLHDVTLTVRPGEHVCVVGSSGSGKSTLARVLSGIEQPSAGEALIGGVPATKVALENLRKRIVVITQESHVFAMSLRENLALGASDASDEQMVRALEDVGATWASQPPWSLDVQLEGQLALSSGQRQQVALARAVLADPDVIVLDESFSGIEGEAAVKQEVDVLRMLKSKTVIAIAHRLETVALADRVVVMSDGQIIEQGTHDALSQSNGVYSQLRAAWDRGQHRGDLMGEG